MAEYKQKQQNLQEYFQNIRLHWTKRQIPNVPASSSGPEMYEFWEESYSKSMILEAVSSCVLG